VHFLWGDWKPTRELPFDLDLGRASTRPSAGL
jgi:hypothetical protein